MSTFIPLDFVVAQTSDDATTPPLMVLCRAPNDDGWLCIEAGTAIIYNIFDPVTHLYARPLLKRRPGVSSTYPSHRDLSNRTRQSELLARARWFHHPAGLPR